MNVRILITALFIFLLTISMMSGDSCYSQSGEYKWFNADHSPFGALGSFVFGIQDKGGGFMAGRSFPPERDIYIAFKSPQAGVKIFPFVHNKSSYNESDFYAENDIIREFRLGSDTWQTPHFQLTFYSPIWNIPDLQQFDAAQQRLVFCPAQLIEISWDNSQSSHDAEILFGVQTKVVEDIQTTVNDAVLTGFYFKSYDLEKGYLLAFVNQGQCEIELMKSENILKEFAYDDYVSGQKSGGFLIRVPPGSKDHVFLLVNHFNGENITTGINSTFYYRELFTDFADAAQFSFQLAEQIKRYCLHQDQKLINSGLNPARQFLVAQSTHSYYANTAFLNSAV
ncbi:glycoside hydrolase family 52 protein [candidate division KSB1 bacterium]|nr:glycoside hydrolase family 52 protein [candidate division KSB1 bacterium]